MTHKTEAQPEALLLELHQECTDFATSLRSAANVVQLQGRKAPPSFLRAADLFEKAASEIRHLKSQFEPTIEDNSQDWAQCDPAVAFHLIDRHAENWADAGKMMTEFAEAKAEVKLKALREELITQANRATAAEQQVTALTQRLDTANALNTEARNQLALANDAAAKGDLARANAGGMELRIAELKAQLSARQAAPDGLHQAAQAVIDRWDSPLWRQEVGTNMLINDLRTALSAAPPPPEREPLTEEQIDAIGDATGKPSKNWHYEFAHAIERAHGIGATND